MKLCFYYESIGTFKNLCPNFDCPLHLYFKKYWAGFFTKMSTKIYSMYQFIKLDNNAISWCSFSKDVALNFFLQCVIAVKFMKKSSWKYAWILFLWQLMHQGWKFSNQSWSICTSHIAIFESLCTLWRTLPCTCSNWPK